MMKKTEGDQVYNLSGELIADPFEGMHGVVGKSILLDENDDDGISLRISFNGRETIQRQCFVQFDFEKDEFLRLLDAMLRGAIAKSWVNPRILSAAGHA